MSVASSAPGKLVLLGEYAVLLGHPAVVMAVNRRAVVELRNSERECWCVSSPGYEDRSAFFELDASGGFRWLAQGGDPSERFALVERVVGSLLTSAAIDSGKLRPASMVLDTRAFFQPTTEGPVKLGLGSSAALTVAMVEAVLRWAGAGERTPHADLQQLLELHRTFQGGRGSGIDLTASFTGGVVEYRLTEDGQTPSARSLELPEGLHLVFMWTGRSASTATFLAKLDEGMRKDDGVVAAALSELGRVSTAGIAHLRAGDVTALLNDVNDFGEAMEDLGHAAGLAILSDEHLQLRRLARKFGVRYKPSGAGGGDVGIGFTDDPEAAAEFTAKAADAGFLPQELEVDPCGVNSECLIFNS